jgi:hypothetical protein
MTTVRTRLHFSVSSRWKKCIEVRKSQSSKSTWTQVLLSTRIVDKILQFHLKLRSRMWEYQISSNQKQLLHSLHSIITSNSNSLSHNLLEISSPTTTNRIKVNFLEFFLTSHSTVVKLVTETLISNNTSNLFSKVLKSFTSSLRLQILCLDNNLKATYTLRTSSKNLLSISLRKKKIKLKSFKYNSSRPEKFQRLIMNSHKHLWILCRWELRDNLFSSNPSIWVLESEKRMTRKVLAFN